VYKWLYWVLQKCVHVIISYHRTSRIPNCENYRASHFHFIHSFGPHPCPPIYSVEHDWPQESSEGESVHDTSSAYSRTAASSAYAVHGEHAGVRLCVPPSFNSITHRPLTPGHFLPRTRTTNN
jgi:hypothetical protein